MQLSIVIKAASAALALLALGACSELVETVQVDVLPGIYPNQLDAAREELEVALLAAGDSARTLPGCLTVSAVSSFDGDAPSVAALRPIALRDVNGDGRLDAIASFSVTSLRDAQLLTPETTHLLVRARSCAGSVLTGSDRVFDARVPVVELPRPSGAESVGTFQLPLFDASRPGPNAAGRELLLRLWYPATTTPAEPATYFLDSREAELNAASSQLPPGIFDLVHAWSIFNAPVAPSAQRPTLLLSTGLGVPLTFYSAIAQDLASQGYIVIGLAHPDVSGVIVYPDGSVSQIDPNVLPEESVRAVVVRGWADDLEFVVNWLASGTPGAPLHSAAQAVLGRVDLSRLGAFGHSFGGAAAVWAASETPVLRASANLDGRLWGSVLEQGPATPVLLLLEEGSEAPDASIEEFNAHAIAAVHTLRVRGTLHNDFSDSGLLVHALAALDPRLEPQAFAVGTIDPARMLVIESTYLRAFFDAAWSGTAAALLAASSPQFPEVVYSTATR